MAVSARNHLRNEVFWVLVERNHWALGPVTTRHFLEVADLWVDNFADPCLSWNPKVWTMYRDIQKRVGDAIVEAWVDETEAEHD